MSPFFTLFDLIGDLARRRYQMAEREFAVLGLNHTEARLLNLLHRAGGQANQESLSQSLYVDRSNAGRALKSLEQKGYIARQQDSTDKRAKRVWILGPGQEAVTGIARLKHQMVENFFGELTEAEAETVVSLLSKALNPPLNTRSRLDPSIGAQLPAPSEKDYWNQRYASKELLWTSQANRFLQAEAADLAPGRALDLACGEGRNAIWLAEQGWRVHAVDLSELAIKKARQQASLRGVAEQIDYQVADLKAYEPEASGFDLVTLIYLQLPQAELKPILKQAAKALAPGGTLLLVAHDASNLSQGYGGPQKPELLYTAAQVVTALEGALDIALEVEKAERVERPVETENGPKIARDCLVRCRRPQQIKKRSSKRVP